MAEQTDPGRRTEHSYFPLSRREFLGAASAALYATYARGSQPDTVAKPVRPYSGARRSRVVECQSDKAVRDGQVHPALLPEMLSAALISLTGAEDVKQAWQALLSPDDVVGLKFNGSGQAQLGTTPAFAGAVVRSLVESGWPAEQLVSIEVPAHLTTELGTTAAVTGFAATPTDFGSGADELALVLSQITAIVDIPFIKSHNIAGITCCLKNLSHGLVKHPARYHGNGCSPQMGDIVALPQIRNKLKLCLVDGLRIVYEGGPDPAAGSVADAGVILASRDPVAADATAVSVLNRIREARSVMPLAASPAEIPSLEHAYGRGLGMLHAHEVELDRLSF